MNDQTKKFIAEISNGSIDDKLNAVDTESALWIETDPKNIEHLCIACIGIGGTFDSGFAYPHSKSGQWAVAYLFRMPKIRKLVALWTHSSTFYSVSGSIHAALWDERKMHEVSGKEFVGLQDQRPIVIHPESAKFGKGRIRKSKAVEYLFSGTGAEEEFQIPVGPVHAGIIEPGHFRFHVIGEKINKLEVRLSYLHRGIESLAQNREAWSIFPLIEQISGDESVANSVAYAQAVETAFEVKVPSRASSLRLILLEMERVYNHLADLGGMSMDVGYYASSSQFLILREEAMRLNEAIFGSRFLRGMVLLGGVSRNISDEKLQQLKSALVPFSKSFSDVEAFTMTSSTFLDRVFTTGRVFPQTATDLSLVGPSARACGISCDLRKHFPYGRYKNLPISESLADDGDVLARFLVKFKEVLESIRLIRLAVGEISSGPISVEGLEKIAKTKAGAFGVGICEASRGGCTFLVRFGKEGRIASLSVRTASFRNWRAIEKAVKSNIIADFPLINKSFNLSYSGADL